jgi:hypothetical protein
LVALYLDGADRDKLDPILDACVAVYVSDLDEDGQVDFKGKAKAFTRTYDFPRDDPALWRAADWEKLSIFLNFLIPKLPAPSKKTWPKGILEAIDMDSYRAEKKAAVAIALPDADAEIEPCRPQAAAQARAGTGQALEHRQGLQRPVRRRPVDSKGRWTSGSPKKSRPRWPPTRVSECEEELRPTERPDRARQGAQAGHHRRVQRRRAAVQAVSWTTTCATT